MYHQIVYAVKKSVMMIIVKVKNTELGILLEFMLLPQMFSKGEINPNHKHPNNLLTCNYWH